MKERFSGKLGYVLAAAGSAVGLGNIWRFPYLAAKHGGGVFLLTYLVVVLTFGYALLIAENGIGRMTRRGPVGAFRKLCAGKTGFLKAVRSGGWINAAVPLIILPYYCVIGGWVTRYVVALAVQPVADFAKNRFLLRPDGSRIAASAACFEDFLASSGTQLSYFFLFVVILVAVIGCGVKKGIERFNRILMPILLLMIVGLCGYCFHLPDAREGILYYLAPDFSKFNYETVVAATGQLFFSLSIAMGIMFTYGSYMHRDDDLISSVRQVELFDTAVAFLAGLMIIPAVVAFGGKAAAENAGVGLVFVTMPEVFADFPGGKIVGVAFFLLVLFAAATSAVSMFETNIQTIGEEMHISRTKAIFVGLAEIVAVGIVAILGYGVWAYVRPLGFIESCRDMNILDALDFISNGVMMPIAAIFTTVLVTAVVGLEKFSAEIKGEKPWVREWIFRLCMRVIVIPCLLIILLHSVGLLK